MKIDPREGDTRSKWRVVLAVRIVTAAVSLAFVALASYDNPVLGGGENFDWFQAALFMFGIVVGAFCFAPLAWNARALTLLVSILLTLAVSEFVLRLALGPQFYGIYQLDEHVLYRLIPGTQRVNTLPPVNGSIRIQYKINSLGFRGEELAPLGASLRVVVYGDSFIQGDFSHTKDTFTVRLKEHLENRIGRNIEVVNAGVAGYGPDQELRRMEDELPILKPDLVLVAIYAGNDFGDLVRNKLYRFSSDESLEQNPYVILQESFARDATRSHNELILRKMLRNARNRLFGDTYQIYPTGREARLNRIENDLTQAVSEYRQYVIEGDNVVHELYRDPYNADVSLTPKSESARYKIAMMGRIIEKMHHVAASQNVPLLFVLIPSPIDVTDMHETGEIDTMRYPDYRRSALTDTLELICNRNQLPVVNLFGPLWKQRARDLYLNGGDDHWNTRGQDFAAELVSNYVTTQGLLRKNHRESVKDNNESKQNAL